MRLSVVTMIQGVGISFVFIPLQVVGFATLPASLRTDAAALYSLSRNIGSAIGVSATSTLLASSFQQIHAQYAEQITPFNRALQSGAQGLFLGPSTPFGRAGNRGANSVSRLCCGLCERLSADVLDLHTSVAPAVLHAETCGAERQGLRSRDGIVPHFRMTAVTANFPALTSARNWQTAAPVCSGAVSNLSR